MTLHCVLCVDDEARLLAPLAMRVLLTGEADLDAVAEAVNAGHIHFYLRRGELSDAEVDARLLGAVDPRILDALQELPRAA